MNDETSPRPTLTEVVSKLFGTSQAEEARLGAVCNIHNQGKQVGRGVLVYDQHVNVNNSPAQLSNYCIITSTKVIEIENFNSDSTYQVVFSKKSKTFNLQQITKSIKETDSGLVIIFVDNCHQDFQHGKKTCSILDKSPLTIANCDQHKELFCYVANNCYNVESGGEDGVYTLKTANNNSGTSGESTNVLEGMQDGTVILQGAKDDVKAVGVFNVEYSEATLKMRISPVWLKSSIMDVLEGSTSPTLDQPEPDGPPPPNVAPPSHGHSDNEGSTSPTPDQPEPDGPPPPNVAPPSHGHSDNANGQAPASLITEPHIQVVPVLNVESPPPPGNQVPAAGSDTDTDAAQLHLRIDCDCVPGCRERVPTPQEVLALISARYVRSVNPSTREEYNSFLKYLTEFRKVLIVRDEIGSLIITVRCSSLQILDELWEDYSKGYLNEMAQNFLVTEEILKEFGLKEVKLTTTIDVKEYRDCRRYFLELSVADQLISKAVTDNEVLLDKLSKYLDRESRIINCWKHLAYVLNVPAEERRKFDMYTEHSPTEDMFNYLADIWNPDLTVKELKAKLAVIHRNDVILLLTEGGYLDEKRVSDFVSSQSSDGNFIDMLSSSLDSENNLRNNWKSLSRQFGIPKRVTDQFGVRGLGPAAALFLHMSIADRLRDLTVGELRGHFAAMERNDLLKVLTEHSCKDSSLVKEVAKAESPLLEDIVKLLNKEIGGVKNWRHLANRLGIPSEVYYAFDTSEGDAKSPTKMMFKWLMQGEPKLSMKDLLDGLKEIGRFDVVEFVTAKVALALEKTKKQEDETRQRYGTVMQELQEMRLITGQAKEKETDLFSGLQKKAAAKGLRIVHNDGGGNCMFSALSHQLQIKKGEKISARELRTGLVQFVTNHPTLKHANGYLTDLFEFVDLSEYLTWPRYLEKMAEDGTWGDDVMIVAAARHLNCAIRIISNRPDFEDILLKPDSTISDGVKLVELVLGHIVDCHYVSLEPVL